MRWKRRDRGRWRMRRSLLRRREKEGRQRRCWCLRRVGVRWGGRLAEMRRTRVCETERGSGEEGFLPPAPSREEPTSTCDGFVEGMASSKYYQTVPTSRRQRRHSRHHRVCSLTDLTDVLLLSGSLCSTLLSLPEKRSRCWTLRTSTSGSSSSPGRRKCRNGEEETLVSEERWRKRRNGRKSRRGSQGSRGWEEKVEERRGQSWEMTGPG